MQLLKCYTLFLFSRTLTAVHDAILEDLVFPSEIVGKRIRVKLDGGRLIKVHLDKAQQNNVEHKVGEIRELPLTWVSCADHTGKVPEHRLSEQAGATFLSWQTGVGDVWLLATVLGLCWNCLRINPLGCLQESAFPVATHCKQKPGEMYLLSWIFEGTMVFSWLVL